MLLGAFPTVASQDEPFRFGLENNNPVFLSRLEAVKGGSFRFLIKGGTGATIVAELVDIYSGDSGVKTSIPLGSSKFSPKGLITFDNVIAEYRPSSEFQYFDIPFRFTEDQNFDRPVLGGVKISVQTQEANAEGFKVESSVVGTFSYFPVGAKLSYSPAVELSQPLILGMGEEFPPFGLIPDFPFLINDGKFTVDYQIENTGDIFLEETSDVVLSGPSFFGNGPGEKAFSFSSKKAFLVPNQIATNVVTVGQKVDDEIVIESLPFGVYTLTTSVSGALGSENKVEDSSTQVIVVFPWKYTLFALILLAAFRKRIRSAVIAAWGVNRSWQEYRKAQQMMAAAPQIVADKPVKPPVASRTKPIASVARDATARKLVRSEGNFHLGTVSDKGFATMTRTNSVTARRVRVKSYKDLESVPIRRRFTLKHNQSREIPIVFNRISYGTPRITITWFEGFSRFETELTVHSWRNY